MRLFRLGLCGVLISALIIASQAADDDVAQMVRGFYKWYIPHLSHSAGNKHDKEMSKYVTERLLARIDKLSKTDKDGVPALDYDPFINAQDFSQDWATKVAISDIKVKDDNATATVNLGQGDMKSTVHLVLARSGGKWKIDNFVPKL